MLGSGVKWVMTFLLLSPLLATLLQPGSATSKPTVVPMFMASADNRGPAFFIECINTTDRMISSGSDVWVLTNSAIRLDGQILNDEGGRVGPGLTTEVRPGATWRGIVELEQSRRDSSFGVAFGALVRAPLLVPMIAGRHTIAVRCNGTWSEDVPFLIEK